MRGGSSAPREPPDYGPELSYLAIVLAIGDQLELMKACHVSKAEITGNYTAMAISQYAAAREFKLALLVEHAGMCM